jgi:hypothetical protein
MTARKCAQDSFLSSTCGYFGLQESKILIEKTKLCSQRIYEGSHTEHAILRRMSVRETKMIQFY